MNIYYYYCDCSLFSDRLGAMAARRKGGQPCDRPARLFLFFFFHITSAISFICLGRSHVFRTFLRWASRTNPCKLIDCSLIYNEASLQIAYVPSQWAKVNIKKKHENQRNGILRNIGTWSACVITSCDHPIFAKWTNNAMWEWKHMA